MVFSSVTARASQTYWRDLQPRLEQLLANAQPALRADGLKLHAEGHKACVLGQTAHKATLTKSFVIDGQAFRLEAFINPVTLPKRALFTALSQSIELLVELHYEKMQNQQQRARLRAYQLALWQGSTEALLYFTEQGTILSANPKAQTLIGYTADKFATLNIAAILPEEWRGKREEFIAKSPDENRNLPLLGWRNSLLLTRADGVKIPVVVNVRQLVWPDQEQPEYLAFIRTLRSTQSLDEQISERVLLQAIIDAYPDPIYARDKLGNYLIANQSSQSFIQPIVVGATAGGPFQELYRQAVADAEKGHAYVLATGQVEIQTYQTLEGERYRVSKSPIRRQDGSIDGVVSVAHNVTAFWQATALLEKQQHLLSVLHKGLTHYGAMLSSNELWLFLKQALKDLTGSEYALLGEVDHSASKPKLKIHAISDLSWNAQSRPLMEHLRSGQMFIDSPDGLLGKAYLGGEVVILDDLRLTRARFPDGHPQLNNFLAVPITDGDEILGMYAIANSAEPYSPSLVEWLEPFTSTCALLIKLQRQAQQHAKTNDALVRAHYEAERASQAKTDFLSSMSHELRTPLNAIMGFAQLLASRTQLDTRSRRQAEYILKSGQHLLELINEILDLARIESGHFALSIEAFHLADALQSSLNDVSALAKHHGVQLSVEANLARNIWVAADFTRLRQVLDNLLSNAIKYNRPKGKVSINVIPSDAGVRVEVVDNGIGIAQDKHALIFTPFNRLGAENGAIEGTGVGLALTKKIIELMQGEIGFSSQEGQGSTFWFSLPADSPQARQARTSNQWKPKEARVSAQLFTVLYVEDNPANAQLMQDIFAELEGFKLISAQTGLSGLELAQQHKPDLIMLDINLPGLNGYQLLTLLRTEKSTADIPVVGLSANAMSRDIQAAYEAGFETYLTKPLNLSELFILLENFKVKAEQARDQRPQ